MLRSTLAVLIFGLLGPGCGVSTIPSRPLSSGPDPEPVRTTHTSVHHTSGNDSPEISRSAGVQGGVVVLWPRILPRSEDPAVVELATLVQARLATLARAGAEAVDQRPAPERVCPKANGCAAASVGAIIARKDKGCAVVALVSRPGISPAQLLPWAGRVRLKNSTAAFRDPPENEVIVEEFVPCDKLKADLASNVAPGDEAALGVAIKGVVTNK